MLRSKDFYMKSVYDVRGKKIGIVEDLFIDFFKERVKGLKVSNYSLFSKKNFIEFQSIISINKDIVVEKSIQGKGLELKNIKGMDIIDLNGNIKGVVEDIIIGEEDFSIKGIVISTGIIERLLKGKDILLLSECILGEEYILYIGKEGVTLKSMPRKVDKNEATN
ncbi:PRC-barrel domain-containing protein [Eubacterium multiforme]|uniref:Uncharacterized protein YrrD n=1 Tax=Eubacterium multiforme TaxID=83339 RepID=A0ABT9UPS3_9FIRM|nr:PRC-barrel domain-containing protein [Eubacterium multiforme]MDQ0148111.1 uncharacterized protein YrrD [Eubacterium multiforme]